MTDKFKIKEFVDFMGRDSGYITDEFERIYDLDCMYNYIFGKRNNGKTVLMCALALWIWKQCGIKSAVVRRFKEQIKSTVFSNYFNCLQFRDRNIISEMTDGNYTKVVYYLRDFYLAYTDDNGNTVRENEPFCRSFAVSEMENDKSVTYPGIENIWYEEFLTHGYYLKNEYILFQNVISTCARDPLHLPKVWLIGNTVDKYCPYFSELEIDIDSIDKDTIHTFEYENEDGPALRVAVWRTGEGSSVQKKSNVLFATKNSRLKMITSGEWELPMYPHLEQKYRDVDVLGEFFINYNGKLLHADVVGQNNGVYIFVHKKTSEIKKPEKDIIYSLYASSRPNVFNSLFSSDSPAYELIAYCYRNNKIFFDSNESGSLFERYIKETTKR